MDYFKMECKRISQITNLNKNKNGKETTDKTDNNQRVCRKS